MFGIFRSRGRRGYRDEGFDPIWSIIGINALVFVIINVAALFSPMARGLAVNLLGLSRSDILSQPWTIVTSMFTHIDFYHILFNMLTFYFFGNFLLSLVGNRRFLVIYFGGGLLGNILFLLWSPAYAAAIGASGAIFALGGALAVLRPNQRVYVFPIPAPLPLWIAVIGGFVVVTILPSVAWQAHLGGLVFGLGAGYLFKRGRIYF